VRRRLYAFVTSQTEPVSREQAAEAVGVARHQAKFHLDRLEAAGLVETDYVRLTGRTGPGAGRTAKRYRRGSNEYAVALPGRAYDLAGQIMAEAITDTVQTGTPIAEALHKAAPHRAPRWLLNQTAHVQPQRRSPTRWRFSAGTGTNPTASARESFSATAPSTASPKPTPSSSAR